MSDDRPAVAAFTDSYLPTVNGVTYTVRTWRDRWRARGGRMDVVYPASAHDPEPGEHPVPAASFPFYEGFRVGTPTVPDAVADVDVVHAHTPFALGLAALRLARRHDNPLVATYHTPASEYADYVAPDAASGAVSAVSRRYERWFLDRADLVLTPSETTARDLRRDLGVTTPVRALPNGVDTDFFRPTPSEAFRDRHDLPDGPLVGYTGRHGHEKELDDLVRAATHLDAPVVFGGDGPARDELHDLAADLDVDAHFLGFLDRDELPAFYSALDVFAFPSPVETEGLVALEANACGTPVVGVDAGALADTVDHGTTGYRYPRGDTTAFADAIQRALADERHLAENCLDARDDISVDHAIDTLETLYRDVR
ncbi:glycosyltransferase [Halocalculus aciditolerans]|uniref:Glycosyl transferase family 1 n=1 Tax=Halocalculus aciditolerans TaxID=1383812 RepID=A0A830F6T5_9EURY|nr:glycosyltransferase [Halocalculus aciditolerans]GGL60158.1 glycosyl transferase family 1 [Halocalculus aciditolerans]